MFSKKVKTKTTKTQNSFECDGQNIAYEVVRSARRRRSIALTLNNENILRLSVPLRTRQTEIDDVLRERARWIVARLKQVQEARAATPVINFVEGDFVSYLGYPCRLVLEVGEGEAPSCRLLPHRFIVRLSEANLSLEDKQAEVRLALRLWFKKRARIKFRQRLDYWAKSLGVKYKNLAIGNPDHRWGSCNAEDDIRLNWQLLLAPLSLLDYVVVHELCHIPHKNHGKGFWNLVGRVLPDFSLRRSKLRQIGRTLKI